MKKIFSVIIITMAMIYSCTNTVEKDNQNGNQHQKEIKKKVDISDSTKLKIEKVTDEINESSDELDKLLKEL